VSRVGKVNLGCLPLEDYLVLLVTRAEGERSREFRHRDSQIAGVAKVVLGFRKGRAGHW